MASSHALSSALSIGSGKLANKITSHLRETIWAEKSGGCIHSTENVQGITEFPSDVEYTSVDRVGGRKAGIRTISEATRNKG